MPKMRDIAEIRKLPVPDRLQLVGEIWESILEDPSLLPVSDELARELQARLQAHRENPSSGEAWASVDHQVFGAE